MSDLDDAGRAIERAQRAEDESWLSVKQYAASRGVHVQTVYSAIRRGLFTHEIDRGTPRTIRIKVRAA